MSIKMRVLYSSSKAKVKTIANEIKREFELSFNAVDSIPPAYSCDKERIVMLIISLKDEPDDQLRLFCARLNKQGAQNVALIMDGTEKAAKNVKDLIVKAGGNFIDDILYIKGGIPFFAKLPDEEKAEVLAWAHRIVEKVQQSGQAN